MPPQELQLMLQDLRKQKEKLIAENLPMTESEAVNLEIASQLPLLHGTAGQGHTNASIQ